MSEKMTCRNCNNKFLLSGMTRIGKYIQDVCRKCGNKERQIKRNLSKASKITRAIAEAKRRRDPKKMARYSAYSKVAYALRAGTIKRSPCEKCGMKKVEAHHDNYCEPLKVRWLCVKHHKIEHGRYL